MKNIENYLITRSSQLVQMIEQAICDGKPIDNLVKQQIALLEVNLAQFRKDADEAGIHNLERAKNEIQILANIRAWAKKIDLSTEKYDNAIKEIRIKILGKEATEKFFNN